MTDETRITSQMRAFVLRRDGYRCVAPFVDGQAGWCRMTADAVGTIITRWPYRDTGILEVNHVKEADELMMARKATADPDHLVSICPWHHRGTKGGSNWEARNRDGLRRYIEDIERPSRRTR